MWFGRTLIRFATSGGDDWTPASVGEAWRYVGVTLLWIVIPISVIVALFIFLPVWVPLVVMAVLLLAWLATYAMTAVLDELK